MINNKKRRFKCEMAWVMCVFVFFVFFFFFYSFKAFHVGKNSWGFSMQALQGFLGKADFEPRYPAPAPILFSQKPLQQIWSLELPVYVYRLYFFTCRRGWAQKATIWLWVGRRAAEFHSMWIWPIRFERIVVVLVAPAGALGFGAGFWTVLV